MAESWPHLQELLNENVVLKTGVYWLDQHQSEPYAFRVPQIKRWYSLLRDGYPLTMEDEANQLLDQLISTNKMNAKTLKYFYQDFLQMLYHTIEGSENIMNELFHTQEELELYRYGMRSVDQMKKLIHHVATHYKTNSQPVDQEHLVKQVVQYINEHLENEIHRDELADFVHLNADYLTRVFKKETGYTLKEYVILQKMQEAKSLLRTTTLPVSIIAAKVGYCNFSHFSYTYKKTMGITPQEERQGTPEKMQNRS